MWGWCLTADVVPLQVALVQVHAPEATYAVPIVQIPVLSKFQSRGLGLHLIQSGLAPVIDGEMLHRLSPAYEAKLKHHAAEYEWETEETSVIDQVLDGKEPCPSPTRMQKLKRLLLPVQWFKNSL